MSTTKRHPASMQATIGADAEGHVTGMVFTGDFNTGAYASWGPTVTNRVPVHASGPYLTPNYRATGRAIHTNGPIAGAFRGFGVPQATIMQETLYDELAGKLGMDRLAFRQKNALRDGCHTVTGQKLEAGVGIAACLDALEPHWQRALADAEAFNRLNDRVRRGVGVASCWYGCGNTSLPNPSTIKVGIAPDGTVVLHQGAVDIGQGSNTVIAQICADALGLPLGAFRLKSGDTGITPDAGKTSASRQTFVSGKAAEKAGRALREKILRFANVSAEGRAFLRRRGAGRHDEGGERRRIDLAASCRRCRRLRVRRDRDLRSADAAARRQGPGQALCRLWLWRADRRARGRHAARHREAGEDHRRARCRQGDQPACWSKGQIEGGIAQGIGMALMEEYIPGRTENLHDYLIPTIGDVPEIESILIEVADPGRAVRRQGARRACADPDRAGDHQCDPPCDGRAGDHDPGDADPRAGGDQERRRRCHERACRTLRDA